MLSKPKNRKLAVLLAFVGAVMPGLHKFYLGQPGWGLVYLVLSWTHIPQVASAIEGVWYLSQKQQEFDHNFNGSAVPQASAMPSASGPVIDPANVGAVAESLRQLDQLRQDGLISEYEFEQKRRQLLDQIT